MIDKQNIEKNAQLLTANIGKLRESVNFKVSTQNKYINGQTSGGLGKPSLPIFANRWQQL